MIIFRKFVVLQAIFLVTSLAGAATCLAAESITVDLPIKSSLKLPARLATAPQQVVSPDGTGYALFSMLPETEGESLFVTVVFREDGKDSPAIFWTGEEAGQQTTLCENLAEGVTGLNQRTIAIPANLADFAGKLVITGEQSKILRVRLDWIPASPVFVAADQPPVSLIAGERAQAASELTGARPEGLPDTWFGSLLDAPLQSGAEAIEESVEFVVPLDASATQVLFRAKFLGLPFDQSVTVWINGQTAGSIQPVIAPLSDAGYLMNDKGEISYAGWRSGAIIIPASLLKTGENSIQIESKAAGVFIRDAALQLRAALQNSDDGSTEESVPDPKVEAMSNQISLP